MLVSVIIPAYQCTETIDIAVTSILNQTYKSIEIIIVDDNPENDDDLKRLYETNYKSIHNIRYYKNPVSSFKKHNHKGVNIDAGYSARNLGISKATGDWITFQDADDFSLLNRIEVQVELAKVYNLNHVITDYVWASPELSFKKLHFNLFRNENPLIGVKSDQLKKLSHEAKGIFSRILPDFIFSRIPFKLKSNRFTRRLFIKNEIGFPGAANSPLIKSDLAKRCRFRHLNYRRWPTYRGRGADRDFNYQLVNTPFSKSACFKVPLYCWKTPRKFDRYNNIGTYLQD